MFCTLSAGLSVDPLLYRREAKTPEFANVYAVNLALTRKSLKSLGVNLNDGRSLLRVEEPFGDKAGRLGRLPFSHVFICHWGTPSSACRLLSGNGSSLNDGVEHAVRPIVVSYAPIGCVNAGVHPRFAQHAFGCLCLG